MRTAANARDFLTLGNAVMGPTSFAEFAVRHPEQLAIEGCDPVDLDAHPDLRADMMRVNGQVNQGIEWVAPTGQLVEPWNVLLVRGSPNGRGDCCSIAATKRAMLLARGWKPGTVLFAHVMLSDKGFEGAHHMVLVIRTAAGDLVLDNRSPGQAPVWWARNYERWVAVQSPYAPGQWCELERPAPWLGPQQGMPGA